MLTLTNLTHCFSPTPPPVLQNVSFSLQPNEFVSLLGPSGCGKSTILKLLAGLIQVQQGEIHWTDHKRPNIGYVFQEPRLIPWRTVSQNLSLPFSLTGQPVSQETVTKHLHLVGLTQEDAKKLPHQLSGGMKMRVSLARALMLQPSLLLFDEPFAALDEMLREQLHEELLSLWSTLGWTGLFVTHNIAEAVFLSQRVLIMSTKPGQIIEEVRIDLPDERTPELRTSTKYLSLVAKISQTMRTIYRQPREVAPT
ncbi:ABC transporter ATP-binding protein [Lacunimicrobium album]